MNEGKIAAYFKQQVRSLIEQSAWEPEGFRAYFADREPKDEEILGLLAVTTMLRGKDRLSDRFPTPVEALAALSPAARSEICREFRQELKSCIGELSPAGSKLT